MSGLDRTIEQLIAEQQRLSRRIERLETLESGPIFSDWTPTVTQSSQVSGTVAVARYGRRGPLAHVFARFVVTSSGTSGSDIYVAGLSTSLATQSTAVVALGPFRLYDSSAGTNYIGAVLRYGDSQFACIIDGSTGWLGASPSLQLGNGDILTFSATYEI